MGGIWRALRCGRVLDKGGSGGSLDRCLCSGIIRSEENPGYSQIPRLRQTVKRVRIRRLKRNTRSPARDLRKTAMLSTCQNHGPRKTGVQRGPMYLLAGFQS